MILSCNEISSQKISYSREKYAKTNSEALAFIKENKLSEKMYILVDLSIHSGKKRMFVINPKTGNLREAFITTHGMGGNSKDGKITFSNIPESLCSSKGKYTLGKKKVPSAGFGHKYIMYGKESSNSNAVKRNIVFHPWSVVPNEETYPKSIPMSWGCPAVSPSAFEKIDAWIQETNKNVLIWII